MPKFYQDMVSFIDWKKQNKTQIEKKEKRKKSALYFYCEAHLIMVCRDCTMEPSSPLVGEESLYVDIVKEEEDEIGWQLQRLIKEKISQF